MWKVNIRQSKHDFDKINLVSLKDKNGVYDIVKCKVCGVKGKRRNFDEVSFTENVSKEKYTFCLKETKTHRIVIQGFTGFGEAFSNITEGSEHDIIPTPKNEKEDKQGVWVMGNGVPVKILNREFEYLK